MNKIVSIKGRSSAAAAKGAAEEGVSTSVPAHPEWSGAMDEAEIARPGGLLLSALIRCANERRMQLNDMARELGVTYGYINQLRNGLRPVTQVSDDFALACARYLGVPRLTVLMMAGRITPEDAFEREGLMLKEVENAMRFICDDPSWGHLVTPELRKASIESQYLVVRMYEKATNKVLMDKHIDIEKLAAEMQKLKAAQAALIQKANGS